MMIKQRFLYTSIWMLLFSTFCFGQTVDPLDFQFKTGSQWNIAYSSMRMMCDSSKMVNGKYPLIMSEPRSFFGKEPLRVLLQQRILLSDNSGGKLVLSICNNTCNVEEAMIIVRTYNEQEIFLQEDSVSILTNGEWKESALTLSAHPFRIIRITIKAIGTERYENEMQTLSLDRMEVLVNGKSINQSSCLQENVDGPTLSLSTKNAYPLTDTVSLSITPFVDKKILGLGETMHQNGAIQKAVFDIFKRQVKQNRCRLILLELPIDFGLMLNWYVSGKSPDSFVEVIRKYTEFSYDDSFIDFIQWLRQYNKDNTEEKVRLFCMDVCSARLYDSSELRFFDSEYIFRPLYAAMKMNPSSNACLYDFVKNVILNKYKDAQAEMAVRRKELMEVLGEDNFMVLQEILQQISSICPTEQTKDYFSAFNASSKRDSWMFLNYEKFSSMFLKPNEKTILYAHIGHLAKSQTFDQESLGTYLSKKYSSAYSSVGIVLGEGTSTMNCSTPIAFLSPDSMRWEAHYNYLLQSPKHYSLEMSAMKIPYEKYFYPFDPIENNMSKLGLMKIISNGIKKEKAFDQFVPVSYNSWMDGFVFIQKGTPLFDLSKIDLAKKMIDRRIGFRDEVMEIINVNQNK